MDYKELDMAIAKLAPDLSAAECHGMATGILCGNERAEAGFWLGEILQDYGAVGDEEETVLVGLFQETKALLVDAEFGFTLLLPDEDTDLSDRLESLSKWCQGFLYGIGSLPQVFTWSDTGSEIIKDIAELTKLDTHAEGEAAENDFMEIVEYLRTAVVFLQTELNVGQHGSVH